MKHHADPSDLDLSFAADRTILANERTLGSWWRTAMTADAAAVGFARFFQSSEPSWLIRSGATCLVLLAFVAILVAHRRYEQTIRRLEIAHVNKISRQWIWLGATLLGLASIAAGIAIWL